MTKKDLIRRVSSDIRRLRRSYYASAGDAFCHYAVREYFDLDEEDTFEYCDIGGKNDKGIDAFWHDDQERRVVVVQAKYSAKADAKCNRTVVTNLASSYGWLMR